MSLGFEKRPASVPLSKAPITEIEGFRSCPCFQVFYTMSVGYFGPQGAGGRDFLMVTLEFSTLSKGKPTWDVMSSKRSIRSPFIANGDAESRTLFHCSRYPSITLSPFLFWLSPYQN